MKAIAVNFSVILGFNWAAEYPVVNSKVAVIFIFSLFIFDPLWKYYNEEVKYDKKYYAQRKRVRKYEEEI